MSLAVEILFAVLVGSIALLVAAFVALTLWLVVAAMRGKL